MRKIFFILLLTVGMVFFTEAQPSAKNFEEVKKEIQRLTSEWNKAVKNQDSIALVEILSPNFTLYSYDIDSGTAAKIPLDKWLYNTLHHFTTDSGGVIGEQKVTVYGLAAKNEHTGFWAARFDN